MVPIKSIFDFMLDVFHGRRVLFALSLNDFKAKFASSFFGILWAFIQPLVTILVFWFVFQLGLKNPPVNDIPFITWFIPAYLAWAFFAEATSNTTNCLMEYGFLLKKVDFRASMIPLVKIISSSYVHIAFVGFIFFINFCYKIPASIYNLQVIYYFVCMVILLVGTGWLLSSLTVFMKDTANIVNVFIQIGFWMTPIFWSPDGLSPAVASILKLNPMFYICRGYRDSFITNVWFWEYGGTNLYFWAVTLSLFVLGALSFKRLRPHFVDLL